MTSRSINKLAKALDIASLEQKVLDAARAWRHQYETSTDTGTTAYMVARINLSDAVAALDRALAPDPWELLSALDEHVRVNMHCPGYSDTLRLRIEDALKWREENS